MNDADEANDELATFRAQFPNYDADSCHQAVKELIELAMTWLNKSAAESTPPEIQSRAEEFGGDPEVDRLHALTYRDAACTHSAIGALAPFYEGAFQHEFAALRVIFENRKRKKPNTYHRWKLAPDDFWSIAIVSEEGQRREKPDVVRTVQQLIKALGIETHFPPEHYKVVRALFSYRNYALHNGYEWPSSARDEFNTLVLREGWDDWFTWSTWGEQLWLSSVSDEFISKCVDNSAKVVEAFRAIREEWLGYKLDF